MSVRVPRAVLFILLSFSIHTALVVVFTSGFSEPAKTHLSIAWVELPALQSAPHEPTRDVTRLKAQAQRPQRSRQPAAVKPSEIAIAKQSVDAGGPNGGSDVVGLMVTDVSLPRPIYPERCLRLGLEGRVEVQIKFDQSGAVQNAEPIQVSTESAQHCPEFVASALDVAKAARLRSEIAALREHSVILPIHFQLIDN